MSKKETRRAARQAFPKAKSPPPSRSSYRTRPRGQRPAAYRGAGARVPKPPSMRRAAIMGGVLGVIYFLLIEYAWKSGANTETNVIIALISFVIFALVTYGIDFFKYRRFLNKQRGSSK